MMIQRKRRSRAGCSIAVDCKPEQVPALKQRSCPFDQLVAESGYGKSRRLRVRNRSCRRPQLTAGFGADLHAASSRRPGRARRAQNLPAHEGRPSRRQGPWTGLGNPRLAGGPRHSQRHRAAGADAHAASVAPVIAEAQAAGAKSLRQIAAVLIGRGIMSCLRQRAAEGRSAAPCRGSRAATALGPLSASLSAQTACACLHGCRKPGKGVLNGCRSEATAAKFSSLAARGPRYASHPHRGGF